MFEHLHKEIKEHCYKEYPKEACGFIAGDKYIPCINTHKTPEDAFQIDSSQYPTDGSLQAVIHSHTDWKAEPTKQDMEGQVATAVPWGVLNVKKLGDSSLSVSDIVFWGDGVNIPELVGRQFRSGPSGTDNKGDCYALIKDYYQAQLGVVIPEFPRDDKWWNTHDRKALGNMYAENFGKAGFRRIHESELKEHDVILMQINSNVTNHGAVYIGGGLMIHHLNGRLSRRDPAAPYRKTFTYYLRHESQDI